MDKKKVSSMVIVDNAQHATRLLKARPKVTEGFAYTCEIPLPLAIHMAKFMNEKKISYTIAKSKDQSAFNFIYLVHVSSTGKSAVYNIQKVANELARKSEETREVRSALEDNRKPKLRRRGKLIYRFLRFKIRTR